MDPQASAAGVEALFHAFPFAGVAPALYTGEVEPHAALALTTLEWAGEVLPQASGPADAPERPELLPYGVAPPQAFPATAPAPAFPPYGVRDDALKALAPLAE